MTQLKQIEFGEFRLTDKTRQNVLDCLESGWLTMGSRVREFEEKWKKLFNYPYARCLSSGTTADTSCLMSLYELVNAKPGDEVLCPALSFIATANSIRAAGFVPVMIDVKKETLNIDEDLIEAKITEKTRCIMAVNLMGRPCELDKIADIAKRHNLILIIDNCEGYSSKFKGGYALDYGDMETSSHFLAHLIFAVEMGVVSSKHGDIDRLIEGIRSHGRMGGKHYFDHQIWGLNFKPSDLHASVGLEELDNFWENVNKRKDILNQLLEGSIYYKDYAWFVESDKDHENAPHGFSITLKKPGQLHHLTRMLDENNIANKRNFGSMASQHRTFKYLNQGIGSFPNAEYIGNNGLHIGVGKYLEEDDIKRILRVIGEFFRKY